MDDNLFVFDLNESLYFESGQEISEMLSISLDPEITVQPFNDYVSIRGVIQLQGEYQKAEVTEENDTPLDLEDHHSRRYLDRVEETREGVASFSHEFPIEISVPSHRVGDVNNIMVNVEWFDYDLPTENQLKLTSQIAIEGISQQREEEQKENESLAESVDLTESENERFEFEIQQVKEDEEEEHTEARQEETPVINESVQPKASEEDEEVEKNRWNKTKSQSFAEFFNTSPSSIHESLDKIESVGSDHVDSSDYIEELMESRESAQAELSESSSEEVENVTYLADMFRDSGEEIEFTKVRICIVQENDTLETIAERYDIPKLQLLKQNRLDGDDLTEGQLLSIPIRMRKQS